MISIRTARIRARARSAARGGDWPSAAARYRLLVKTGAATARDHVQLAHVLKEAGKLPDAEAAYSDAAARFPLDLDAQRQLGVFLRLFGNRVAAVAAFVRAAALAPDARDIERELENLGAAGSLDRRFLVAALAYEPLPPRAPGFFQSFRFRRLRSAARRAARSGSWRVAAERYQAAAGAWPTDDAVLVQLGHVLRIQGEPLLALKAYRRALALAPRLADTYLHYGHALKELGDSDAAVASYLTAWRLKPGYANAADELTARGWSEADLQNAASGAVDLKGLSSNERGHSLVMPAGLSKSQRSIWIQLAAIVPQRA